MEKYLKCIKLNRDNVARVWKEFIISKLFAIKTGTDIILSQVSDGDFPITSNRVKNNSIARYSSEIEGRELYDCSKTISVADRGKFYASVQAENFYIGTRVKALVARFEECDKNILHFIVTIINQESFRFNYGRNCCDRFEDLVISLPIIKDKNDSTHKYSDDGYIPDFQFMRDYIKEKLSDIKADMATIPDYFLNEGYDKACWYMDNINIEKFEKIYKPSSTSTINKLNVIDWQEFMIGDIFCFRKGKRITKSFAEINKGDIPVIGGGESNNGIMCNLDESLKDDYVYQENGCFTVAAYGSAGVVFYHNHSCFIDDKALSFVFKQPIITCSKNNIFICLFFVTILNKLRYKYNYGRGAIEKRYSKEIIRLPICYEVDKDGFKTPKIDKSQGYHKDGYIPDFQFMEDYIKSLPFTKALETNFARTDVQYSN